MEVQMLSGNNEDEFNSLECYSLFVIETRIPIRVLIKFAPFSLPSARLQTTPPLYMMRTLVVVMMIPFLAQNKPKKDFCATSAEWLCRHLIPTNFVCLCNKQHTI